MICLNFNKKRQTKFIKIENKSNSYKMIIVIYQMATE